jgi:antitoxin YefM
MVSADEWESVQESLFWLSQPRSQEDLAKAEEDIAAGRVYDEGQVRQALNLPSLGAQFAASEPREADTV